jgi:type IV secretory pathway VirB2 component (pilin)
MATAPSLFDAPSEPVFAAAGDWLAGVMLGSIATGLCVLAVAFIGLRMMTGHLAVRDSLRIVIGCFLLLGAPLIAGGLRDAAGQSGAPGRTVFASEPRPELPTAPFDPYAGASAWQNWQGMQPDPFAPRPQAPR